MRTSVQQNKVIFAKKSEASFCITLWLSVASRRETLWWSSRGKEADESR